MTYGEQMKEALKCETVEQANAFVAKEIKRYRVDFPKECGHQTDDQIHEIITSNLGYMAGYYSDDVAVKIRKLFGATHPIFGDKKPTAEEALEAGKKMARSR